MNVRTSELAKPVRVVQVLAWTTVALALPLVFLGAHVTTNRFGMIDPVGYRGPLYFLLNWADQGMAWLIEHGHRQFGFFVGMSAIAFVAASWLLRSSRLVRVLSALVLGMVIVQGLLGIFRIELHALYGQNLAWIHGCFAQLVFAVMVLAAVSSGGEPAYAQPSRPLRRAGLHAVVFVYLQLVLGGLMRHFPSPLVLRLHLLGAFAVTASLVWLAVKSRSVDPLVYNRLAIVVYLLLAFQVMLGTESFFSWYPRYRDLTNELTESSGMKVTRTIHYLVGTLIFATSCVFALRTHQALKHAEAPA